MPIHASVVFPVYFTLSEEQTEEYNKLSESNKDEYLLMLEKE